MVNKTTKEQEGTEAWGIFPGNGSPVEWPTPPAWRGSKSKTSNEIRGETYQPSQEEIDAVNAAIFLRRPLLITGKPGVGKSSLAHSIVHRLKLDPVLVWPISTKSTLREGLYLYDAIARLQALQPESPESKLIDDYITLGPLGTALHKDHTKPQVVLIDEIDKSDVDLPNDLLNVLEEGEFKIDELARLQSSRETVSVSDARGIKREIKKGLVKSSSEKYPIVVLTSNGERDFPAPFLRRCIRLRAPQPDEVRLRRIVSAHNLPLEDAESLIATFITERQTGDIATDQLLNAIFLLSGTSNVPESRKEDLQKLLLKKLSGPDSS